MRSDNSKGRTWIVVTAKWALVLMVLVFMWSLRAGSRVSGTPFADVSRAVTAQVDLSVMQKGDNQMIKRLYGLDPSEYENCLLYYPTTNMGSEELLLICLKDTSQQETVRAAMEGRMADQMDSFDGYAIPQYEMCESAVIEIRGNYALLISAEDPSEALKAFLDAL